MISICVLHKATRKTRTRARAPQRSVAQIGLEIGIGCGVGRSAEERDRATLDARKSRRRE